MTDAISFLLTVLHRTPSDATAWLALADALEEDGQAARAELVRVSRELATLTRHAKRRPTEKRVAKLLAAGVEPCVPTLTNSIGMRFALIPAGSFMMGSPEDESHRFPDEDPAHWVTITRPFYFGIYPVTQAEYRAVTGNSPSGFCSTGIGAEQVRDVDTERLPVECVDWPDCVAFCAALSARPNEKRHNRTYRLPTEAEWEYACRAGTATVFHQGNDLSSHDANFDGNRPSGAWKKGPSLKRTSVVGSYPPNAWGLYDMHGNVWEWCHDWFASDTYRAAAPRIDPRGPDMGEHRVMRGGSWTNEGFYLRAAHRGWSTADHRIGFRVVLEHPAGV